MDTKTIMEIAEDRIFSDLCLKWYLSKDEEIKRNIYENEIIPFYEEISKQKKVN